MGIKQNYFKCGRLYGAEYMRRVLVGIIMDATQTL
jgi:hypothetical protein